MLKKKEKKKKVQYRRGREFPESTWLKFLEVASQLFLEMYCIICIHVYLYSDTSLEGRGCSSVGRDVRFIPERSRVRYPAAPIIFSKGGKELLTLSGTSKSAVHHSVFNEYLDIQVILQNILKFQINDRNFGDFLEYWTM